MVSLIVLRYILGIGLKAFGIVWALGDKLICQYLCGGRCNYLVGNSCSLILLFVGIIFIVVGYAIVVMKDHKRERLGKKIKRNLKLIEK
jgi:hypothetical protein|tara:strand:- start:752 stop:1018 length:267 start_codon:yes stop_codon:yes gene_type:complete